MSCGYDCLHMAVLGTYELPQCIEIEQCSYWDCRYTQFYFDSKQTGTTNIHLSCDHEYYQTTSLINSSPSCDEKRRAKIGHRPTNPWQLHWHRPISTTAWQTPTQVDVWRHGTSGELWWYIVHARHDKPCLQMSTRRHST